MNRFKEAQRLRGPRGIQKQDGTLRTETLPYQASYFNLLLPQGDLGREPKGHWFNSNHHRDEPSFNKTFRDAYLQ